MQLARLALAFAIGLIAILLLVTAAALAAFNAYSNRVVPGVRVGSVDVSGLSRDQLIARLKTDYAYLGQGEIKVTTPVGVSTITYQEAGRVPDVEFMADAAMRVGHTGNPIDDAVFMLRSAIDGQSVPIAVRVDPMAVATRVRQLVGTTQVLPRDAQATAQNAIYGYSPATPGHIIDEKAISSAIVDGLTQPDAPAAFQAGGALVALDPQVSDADAQAAVAEAERMAVDVTLTWGGDTQAQSPSPSTSKTAIPAVTYSIAADTVRSWIVFGTRPDGSYGAFVDPAPIQAYLSALAPKVATKPVEPSVVFDKSGKPTGVKNGKDGAGIDVAATSQAIVAYLDSLASGGNPGSTVAIVQAPISPRITPESLTGMVVIGSWTTVFYPGITNGYGANIRVPANILNGQIVAPGQRFSFLAAVGPVDRAHGFTLGGVIERRQEQPHRRHGRRHLLGVDDHVQRGGEGRARDRRAAPALLLHRSLSGRTRRHRVFQRRPDVGSEVDQRHAEPDRDPRLYDSRVQEHDHVPALEPATRPEGHLQPRVQGERRPGRRSHGVRDHAQAGPAEPRGVPDGRFLHVQDPHRDRLDRQGDPSRHLGFPLREGGRAAADRSRGDSTSDPDARRTRTGPAALTPATLAPISEPGAGPSAPQDPVAAAADGRERSPRPCGRRTRRAELR